MNARQPYYIEAYRPPFPRGGMDYRVHRGPLNRDALSPDLTALVRVDNVRTQREAIALAIERLAGRRVTVEVL